jgi:hypothetical protein
VIVTVPLEDVMVPLPRVTPPLVIVMVPVGPVGTEAVIVTDWPKVLEPGVLTVTVGVVLLTTWSSTLEVSELNFAVILCDPTSRVAVVKVAVLPKITPVPMVVEPSRKVTVPVFPEGKVAVKMTDCVYVEGLAEELRTTLETVAVTVFEVLGL